MTPPVERAIAGVLSVARSLKKDGRAVEAVALLRDALSRGTLSPEETERFFPARHWGKVAQN